MIYIMTFKILKYIKVKLNFKRQIDHKLIDFQDFYVFKMYNSKNTQYDFFRSWTISKLFSKIIKFCFLEQLLLLSFCHEFE